MQRPSGQTIRRGLLLAWVVTILGPTPPALSGQLFPNQLFKVGDGPRSIAIEDLNGDGRLDLAVANSISNDVSVLLGYGDGTFAAESRFPAGLEPWSIVAADLNQDGALDLAVANGVSNDVSILLATNGAGAAVSFAPEVRYAVGDAPHHLVAGDFDGNGAPDLAVSNFGCHNGTCVPVANELSLLLGRGDGTFEPQLLLRVGDHPSALAAGDVNADGRLDLAVANAGSCDVSIIIGAGDGTFAPEIRVSRCVTTRSLEMADVDEDGHQDLVFVSSVLLGDGSGGFPVLISTGGSSDLTIEDFDADGSLDIAGSHDYFGLSLQYGAGDGTFAAPIRFVAGGEGNWFLDAADVDRDGMIDVLIAAFHSGAVAVVLNRSDGTFGPETLGANLLTGGMTVADLTDDGILDLVYEEGDDLVAVRPGIGDGTFGPVVAQLPCGIDPGSFKIADLDGDGDNDLAVLGTDGRCPSTPSEGDVCIFQKLADGTFLLPPLQVPVGICPRTLTAADFDNEGFVDLAVGYDDSREIAIFAYLGTALERQSVVRLRDSAGGHRAIDFDSDGRLDLAVREGAGISILLQSANGRFVESFRWEHPTLSGFDFADLDRDGLVELVAAGCGDVHVLSGNGDGTFGAATTFPASPPGLFGVCGPRFGDFNADGNVDIAGASSSRSGTFVVLEGGGDATFGAPLHFSVGPYTYPIAAAGDLDGDGRTDLVLGAWDSYIALVFHQPSAHLRLDLNGDRLSWEALPKARGYDVVQGSLSDLAGSGGDFTAATRGCVADDTSETFAIHPDAPAPGQIVWYLARGVLSRGRGSYESGSPSQVGARTAEIAESSLGCP